MRVRTLVFGSVIVMSLLVATAALGEDAATAGASSQTNTVATASGSSQTKTAAADPLLQLLVDKGVIDAEEAKSLTGTPEQRRVKLLELLRQKGILSASDYAELAPASAQVEPNLVASASPILAGPQTKEPGPI